MAERRFRLQLHAGHAGDVLQSVEDLRLLLHRDHRLGDGIGGDGGRCGHGRVVKLRAFRHQLAAVFVVHKHRCILDTRLAPVVPIFLVVLVSLLAVLLLLLFLRFFVLFAVLRVRRFHQQRRRLLRVMNVVRRVARAIFGCSIYFQD